MTAHQVRSYGPSVTRAQRTPDADPVLQYEIRVAGHLPSDWSAWFDDLCVTTQADGTTAIRGPVIDQAALHGLIQKLRDLGIPLLAITPIPSDPPTELAAHPTPGEPT